MHFLLIPCLWLLASLAATAAPRTCRVLFLGAPADAPRSLQIFDGTSAQHVELPRMNFSPVYELSSGDITLLLLEKVPEKPEDIPADSPIASIREGITDFYLLISTDPGNKTLPVSIQIIDANSTNFRKGQLLWFNLTPNRVGGKLGSEKLALEPNSKKITDAPAKGSEDYPVDIYYQFPGKEDIWPLCETKWLHNPAARIVMFVLPEAGSRVPRIMSFTDFREEKEKR
ncbi:MAG: hypothetical protein H7Y36_04175 [Armatimonadetes bacterium]|nr:hypothetical protein [Akkermansiaceae bacterium]